MTTDLTPLDPNFHSQPKREIDLLAAYRIIISSWLLYQKEPASKTHEEQPQGTSNRQ